MLKMLWSGLCYFLNGTRRHQVLLGELSEHTLAEGTPSKRVGEFSESRTNQRCRTFHLGNTKQAGLHLRYIHPPYTALERSAHNTTCEPCRPLATYVARCRGVRRIVHCLKLLLREQAPDEQFSHCPAWLTLTRKT